MSRLRVSRFRLSQAHLPVRAVMRWLVALLVVALMLPAGLATAAPTAQFGNILGAQSTDDSEMINLGQFVYADLASGESRIYTLAIPESAAYLFSPVDAEAAADFDLIVTNEAGEELYNDVFAETELTLEPGTITLEFVAIADNTLSFWVLSPLGNMSSDETQPGKLQPGSVYIEDGVSDARYATLVVPETAYPQQVLIVGSGEEGDTFYISANNDLIFESISTDTDDLLTFWTHGGEYLIYAEPNERLSSLTLVIFTSGRPLPIEFDSPVEDFLSATSTETVFELEVDSTYTDVTIDLESDADLNMRLVDNYADPTVDYSSSAESQLLVDGLYPGVYYLFVQSDSGAEEDIPFTVTVSGEEGRAVSELTTGTALDDEFVEGEESIVYSFEVANPGSLITVEMVTDEDETDFDLYAGLRPGVNLWSNYIYGSSETVTFMAPVAGTYYVGIDSNDGVGPFTITASEGDTVQILNSGEIIYGTVEGRSRNIYALPVSEPGQMLSVALVGGASIDLDLQVQAYNAQGDSLMYLSGYSSGSAELVSSVLTEPAIYEVVVSASFSDEGGAYFLEALLVDPNTFGGQWAVDAVASSQYGEDGYAAIQATGPSDTPTPGDQATAWASQEADGGMETLELVYEIPVTPAGVAIVESYNPGAVVAIEALDPNGEWVVLWEGEAAVPEETYRTFVPEFTPPDFTTTNIRLTLDTAAVPGWNEIDAVQLLGRP